MSFQRVNVAKQFPVLCEPFFVARPPLRGLQQLDGGLIITVANDFGGHSAHDGIGRHVLGDDRMGKDDRAIMYLHAANQCHVAPYPAVVAYLVDQPARLVIIAELLRHLMAGKSALLRVLANKGKKQGAGSGKRRLVGVRGIDVYTPRADGGETAYLRAHQPVIADVGAVAQRTEERGSCPDHIHAPEHATA